MDEYDPRKPEYIAPATEEEVEETDAKLLAQQIRKLETFARRGGPMVEKAQIIDHYVQVAQVLRSEEAVIATRARRRAHSEGQVEALLALNQDEAVAPRRRSPCHGGHRRVVSEPVAAPMAPPHWLSPPESEWGLPREI